MKPFFSVLVPVYNQVGKMDLCIETLKEQSFRDFEVILVDDGSTDDSLSMLKGFAAEDSRFRVYGHEKNQSLLAARYTGMGHAQGEYILFVDSDDFIEKTMMEELHRSLSRDPVDILRFGFISEPDGGATLPYPSEDPLRDYMNNKFPPAIWKNCYSCRVIRKLLERSGPFYCNMGEDVCLAGILFSCAESFAALDRCFYHYVVGEGMSSTGKNLTMEKLQRDLRSVEASRSHLVAFIREYNPAYLEEAERKTKGMKMTVLVQHVLLEKDWEKALLFLSAFNTEQDRDVFCWGCSEIIPQKVYFRITGEKWGKPIVWDY